MRTRSPSAARVAAWSAAGYSSPPTTSSRNGSSRSPVARRYRTSGRSRDGVISAYSTPWVRISVARSGGLTTVPAGHSTRRAPVSRVRARSPVATSNPKPDRPTTRWMSLPQPYMRWPVRMTVSRARWLIATPFGEPVDPEVWIT